MTYIKQKWCSSHHQIERRTVITIQTGPVGSQPWLVLEAALIIFSCILIFMLFWFLGLSHETPTPPSTPKTNAHMGPKREVHQPMDAGSLLPSSRQNIDFSNVDISDLSSDVIGTMDGFDVHVFDQYLSPNNHGPTALPPSDTGHGYPNPSGSFTLPGIHSNSTPTWTRKSPTSTGMFSYDKPIQSEDTATRKPQVKTEQPRSPQRFLHVTSFPTSNRGHPGFHSFCVLHPSSWLLWSTEL